MSKTAQQKLDDVLEEKTVIERSGRLHWFHWLIVFSSLLLTFGAWYFAKTQLEIKNKNQFDREARRVVELVSERMRKYEDALWSGVAAIHSQSHGIDYEEWKRFSATLRIDSRYPGINGIGVIYHVMPDEVEAYLEERHKMQPDFKIYPPHSEKEFLPITFIEPIESNFKAVGLDMAHENNRYTAAKKSRDSTEAQITGSIILVQDSEKTPGFLFFAPFYERDADLETVDNRRENFVGMVYAPFIFKKLMRGTLEIESRHVGLRITDIETVLFDEHRDENPDFDTNPVFTSQVLVSMYGRSWLFDIRSNQAFRRATYTNKPRMILVGGLIIDALLLGLFMFLASANRRAIRFADNMVGEYEEQATHLKNIINSAVDGLMTVDEQGAIQSFNPACEYMFGYLADEVIGRHVDALIPQMLESVDGEGIEDMPNVHSRELEGIRKDSGVFPLDFSVSKVVIDGETLYSTIIRDITERNEARQHLEDAIKFQELTLDNIPDLVFVKDEDLHIVKANKSFLKLYPEDERDKVIGRTGFEDFPPDQVEDFTANDREALEKGYNETQETISFPNGEERILSTKKVAFESYEKKYILGVARDITAMKKAEEEILRSNEELERFAYVASHDLQEPLRMVTNFTGLLKKRYEDKLDEQAIEYINFASNGAFRMQELVADLLEYARIGQDAERYEAVDLNTIMETVEENLQESVKASKAKVTHKELPVIYANPVRMVRLLQNLVGNGLKYQEEGKAPKIKVSAEKKSDMWVICVEDNGIGMKQEYCKKIFEPFKRLHSKTQYSGTGIGLAICRKIVEGLGGEIWAESKVGKGSRFYFTAPIDMREQTKLEEGDTE